MDLRVAAVGVVLGAMTIGVAAESVLAATGATDAQLTQVIQEVRNALALPSQSTEDLQALAERLRAAAPENQLVQQQLRDRSAISAETLRKALQESIEILSFEPVEEAPLPAGFPLLTPVGEIRVNEYPPYRIARTPITGNDSVAFWRLFRHIQSRKIAMTSPVEMTYGKDGPQPQQAEMAFLYRSVEQGEQGRDGEVEVVDVPAQLALSIGWCGDTNDDNVAAARELLDAWLQAHSAEYRVVGKMRVMGHNSPFIAKEKRYFEVQVPVISMSPRPTE